MPPASAGRWCPRGPRPRWALATPAHAATTLAMTPRERSSGARAWAPAGSPSAGSSRGLRPELGPGLGDEGEQALRDSVDVEMITRPHRQAEPARGLHAPPVELRA